ARYPAGHARPDDPHDRGARADARLRHLAAPRRAEPRHVPGQPRLALSRSVPSRAGWQAQGRMARVGQQPQRQVLRGHRVGAEAPGRARPPVGPRGVCDRERAGGRMTILHRLASIVRWALRRDAAERHLDEELRAFVDLSAADKIRDGVPPAEARRLAVLELGGVEPVKERVRTGRHGAWLHEIARDVRYACRTFARNPGFVSVVVLTLALGIGTNTAIFSLIDALMLRWLPVPNPQELVQLTMRLPDSRGPAGESFSYAIVR